MSAASPEGHLPSDVGDSPRNPEESTTFRVARLLLLLDVAEDEGRSIPTIDRLGYYEFFADSPFLVTQGDRRTDMADTATLELAGFSRTQLAYASTGQRFASRRRRLQHDLAKLVSLGLVAVTARGFEATSTGRELVGRISAAYATAYRTAASIILRRLTPMSNRSLDLAVENWMGRSVLLLDLLEDVGDTAAPRPSIEVWWTRSAEIEGDNL